MKVKSLILLLLFICFLSCDKEFENQDEQIKLWVEKSKYIGGYLTGAVSFSLDSKLYVGTGLHDSYVSTFYVYDYKEDSWEMILPLPAVQRTNAISFSIGEYGYIGLGEGKYDELNDLWRINPKDYNWTQMADFPGTPRTNSTCFVIGNNAYITAASIEGEYELWEYNSLNNIWTEKNGYPGNCPSEGISFTINNKGYVGLGWWSGICRDFWEYNPANNLWIQKASFPGKPRSNAVGFSFKNTGFVLCGYYIDISWPVDEEYLSDIWQYDSEKDEWLKLESNYPGKGRIDMIAQVINGKIIIGLGSDNITGGSSSRYDDIWEFIPNIK